MKISIDTDERNAEALLKWLSMFPRETYEQLPNEAESFLTDVELALVRR